MASTGDDAGADVQGVQEPGSAAPTAPDTARAQEESSNRPGAAASSSAGTARQPSSGGQSWCILIVCIVVVALLALGALGHWLGLWTSLGLIAGKHELTGSTWESATAGKTVFVKFYAPWCGHCKRMKPDWDQLMEQYSDSPVVKVAEVDCVGSGKALCDQAGVRGYPTIKYGDPDDLQDYKGGRTFKDLSGFAASLGPLCGPAHLDQCDEERKAKIEKYQAMSSEAREELLTEQAGRVQKIEADFKVLVEEISKRYQEALAKKDDHVKRIKDSGLQLLKAVAAHEAKVAAEL